MKHAVVKVMERIHCVNREWIGWMVLMESLLLKSRLVILISNYTKRFSIINLSRILMEPRCKIKSRLPVSISNAWRSRMKSYNTSVYQPDRTSTPRKLNSSRKNCMSTRERQIRRWCVGVRETKSYCSAPASRHLARVSSIFD